ncbi:MAG: hypothetical protein GX448_12610 [Planctomycetes bacterium]|nr:hypothetical protein [Planctomycetota bacterium]
MPLVTPDHDREGFLDRLADYPWSSYRALAYRRGGSAWFDRRFGCTTRGGTICCRACTTGWCWAVDFRT